MPLQIVRNDITNMNVDAIVNGDRVQISRAKRKAFLAALNHYMGDTI